MKKLFLTYLLIALMALCVASAAAESAVVLPADLDAVAAETFRGDATIVSVAIPEGCTAIGAYAFADCTALTEATIPESVTSIDAHAFDGCSALTIHAAPGSYAAQYARDNGLHCVTGNESVIDSGVCGASAAWRLTDDGSLYIEGTGAISDGPDPEDDDYDEADAMPWEKYVEDIRYVEVCDGITGIGRFNFCELPWLTRVVIADSVTEIGDGAFCECGSLTSVRLPAKLQYLDAAAFASCTSLPDADIPDGVTWIGPSAFSNCERLARVHLPEALRELSESTFSECTALTEITLPDGVEYIRPNAFAWCYNLAEIHLPADLSMLQEGAFQSCDALGDVDIPEGAWSLESRCFTRDEEAAEKPIQITLPTTLSEIADDAFECSGALTARVHRDTYAHKWCVAHGIPVIVLDDGVTAAARATRVNDVFGKLLNWYADKNGYVASDKLPEAIAALEEEAREAQEAGDITEYHVQDDLIWYVDAHLSHTWIVQPAVEGLLSGDVAGEVSLLSYDAFFGTNALDAAKKIDRAIDYYALAEKFRDAQVNLDALDKLGPNQVILWMGHGSCLEAKDNLPVMDLGMVYKSTMSEYGSDMESMFRDRTVNGLTGPALTHFRTSVNSRTQYVCITPIYLYTHPRRMDNSLVWLGICEGGRNSQLADAFLSFGAAAVYGYSGPVGVECNKYLLKQTVQNLLSVNPKTQKHFTLGEASAAAFNEMTNLLSFHPILQAQWTLSGFTEPRIFPQTPDDAHPGRDFSLWQSTVRGSVLADDGATPVAGQVVRFVKGTGSFEATAAEDGSFALRLPAGTYEVSVRTEERGPYNAPEDETVTVASDGEYALEYRLQRRGVVHGRVTDVKGKPIENALVQLLKDGDPFNGVRTDAEGNYRLYAREENFDVLFVVVGYPEKQVEVKLPFGREMVMNQVIGELSGVLKGRVTIAGTSSLPIPGARVVCTGADGTVVATAEADGDGYYRVVLPEEHVTVAFSAEGYNGASEKADVPVGEEVTLDKALGRECGTINGYVFDSTGTQVIPDAAVAFDSIDGTGHVFGITPTTSASGTFMISAKPGKYTLTVSKAGYLTQTQTVEALNDETTNVTVRLPEDPDDEEIPEGAGAVSGAITDDADGAGLDGSNVIFALRNAEGHLALIDRPHRELVGQYRFTAPTGVYTMLVNKPGYKPETYEIEVTEGETLLRNVRLTPDDDPIQYEYIDTTDSYWVRSAYDCTGEVTIPETHFGKKVTGINYPGFHENDKVTYVYIPDTVTYIDVSSFAYCISLKKVRLPAGLTEIHNSTFTCCESLEEIHIPETVKRIGTSAFLACKKLGEIRIPESVESIGPWAFEYTAITEIDIPEGVDLSTSYLFFGCRSLTRVGLPKGRYAISEYAFGLCTSLESIDIPEGVTVISGNAFSDCTRLTEVRLPNTLTSIRENAFCSCKKLTDITIPESVTEFDRGAFSGCTGPITVRVKAGSPAEAICAEWTNVHAYPVINVVTY